MIKQLIPEGCSETMDKMGCPFCYDSIYCNAYNQSLSLDRDQIKPEWCKADLVIVIEKGD